jgi:hypothetical protein
MKRRIVRFLETFAAAATVMALTTGCAALRQAPSIEGTYKLVSRKLPDGRVQTPPEAIGLMTFTKTHRNMNVLVNDASGKHFSLSQVSTYKLAGGEYSETLLYQVVTDQITGKGTAYNTSSRTQSSPANIQGGRVQFKFPFEAPTGTFEGDKLTATTPNGLVAVWEKVQ